MNELPRRIRTLEPRPPRPMPGLGFDRQDSGVAREPGAASAYEENGSAETDVSEVQATLQSLLESGTVQEGEDDVHVYEELFDNFVNEGGFREGFRWVARFWTDEALRKGMMSEVYT